MSQASDGKEYWYCIKSACPGRNFPSTIPLNIGITFLQCPFCGANQHSQQAISSQAVSQFCPSPETDQANVVR